MQIKNENSFEELNYETVTYVEDFVKLENASIGEETSTSKNLSSPNTSTTRMECELCGKIFYKKHVLEVHLRKHCGLKVILNLLFFEHQKLLKTS